MLLPRGRVVEEAGARLLSLFVKKKIAIVKEQKIQRVITIMIIVILVLYTYIRILLVGTTCKSHAHMCGCHNYGLFLDPYYTTAPNI